MSGQPEIAVLAEAGFRSVKGLQKVLAHAGIEAHVVRPTDPGKG